MQTQRGYGILLHPTSLPGCEPIGTLGGYAHDFVDLLQSMGASWWQVLPLNPPSCCNSPYSAFSAFAGNPLLVDLEKLVREGDLPPQTYSEGSSGRVDFDLCYTYKERALEVAATAFFAAGHTERMTDFWHFCDTTGWLHDYALFMALHKKYKNKPWWSWPKQASLITTAAYEKFSIECGTEIGVQKYIQWQFYRQWESLKKYANGRGIRLIGDIPIFVARNSADVWCNRSLFLLDDQGKPTEVAGVPPDYFSKSGQLWGNPLYDWGVLELRGYDWWRERFRAACASFDVVRLDHFRGFEAAWHVPAMHKTAVKGRWVKGPGVRLFDSIQAELGRLPLIAEDLGVITPEVEELRDRYDFPGMKILQFAFGSGAGNPYLPHNHCKRTVVYTGTHDNNTTLGWYHGLTAEEKKSVHDYLGNIDDNPLCGMLRTACMSVADMVIFPLQDVLGLAAEHRMNIPGEACGNWGWRVEKEMLSGFDTVTFRAFMARYGRCCENTN